jgi:hypothetical protein
LIERLVAENQVTYGVRTALSEVAQIVVITPINDALWQLKLWISTWDSTPEKPGRSLIL